jgi:DNA-binding MarR family transcriptional regulator
MADDAVLVARDVRVAVGRLARQLRKLYSQGQAPGDSSFLELAVLLRTERIGPCSASTLATGERVTSQAVSVALAGLRRRGLVRVTTDPSDRRRSLIEISEAGRETLKRRERQIGDRLADVVTANFSDGELECLHAAAPLLNRIADLL